MFSLATQTTPSISSIPIELVRLILLQAPDHRSYLSMLLSNKVFGFSLLPQFGGFGSEDVSVMQNKFLKEVQKEVYESSSKYPCSKIYTILPNGKKHGLYSKIYKDDDYIIEIPYVNGIKQGTLTKRNLLTRIVLEETPFVNGVVSGKQRKWFSNGNIKEEAHYENGNECGWTVSYYKSGEVRLRWKFLCAKIARQLLYRDDGTLDEETRYIAGSNKCIEIKHRRDGTIKREINRITNENNPFLQDHGLARRWSPDGRKVLEETYSHGELHGPVKETYDGRIIKEGRYFHDQKFGEWKVWDRDGTLVKQGSYDSYGTRTGAWFFRGNDGNPRAHCYDGIYRLGDD